MAPSQPILPVVGPHDGETAENAEHRRGVLRNVSTAAGLSTFQGIENVRAVQCFFIAIIQGILHHSRVAQFCRYHHIGPRSARPDNARLVQHHIILDAKCGYCQLYEMLVRYWTKHFDSQAIQNSEVNRRFQKLIVRFKDASVILTGNDELAEDTQQDAADAYRAFIIWLRQSHTCESQANPQDVTSALFKIGHLATHICQACNATSYPANDGDDSMILLSFPENNRVHHSLEFLLSYNFEDGTLVKRCGDCTLATMHDPLGKGNLRDGEPFITSTKFSHFPELLCINLKIYEYDLSRPGVLPRMTGKIVDIPHDLDLSSYSTENPPKGSIQYKLCAVIKHIGGDLKKGHYIAFVREPKKETWMCCNDTEIDTVNKPEVTRFLRGKYPQTPYLLFYERIHPQDSRDPALQQAQAEYTMPHFWKGPVPDSAEPADADEPIPTTEDEPPAGDAQGSAGSTKRPTPRKATKDGPYVPDKDARSNQDDTSPTPEPATGNKKPSPTPAGQPRPQRQPNPSKKATAAAKDSQAVGGQKAPKQAATGLNDSQPAGGQKAPKTVATGLNDSQPARGQKAPKTVAAGVNDSQPAGEQKAPKITLLVKAPNYKERTVIQLKALMKERDIKVARADKKADLITKLEAADAAAKKSKTTTAGEAEEDEEEDGVADSAQGDAPNPADNDGGAAVAVSAAGPKSTASKDNKKAAPSRPRGRPPGAKNVKKTAGGAATVVTTQKTIGKRKAQTQDENDDGVQQEDEPPNKKAKNTTKKTTMKLTVKAKPQSQGEVEVYADEEAEGEIVVEAEVEQEGDEAVDSQAQSDSQPKQGKKRPADDEAGDGEDDAQAEDTEKTKRPTSKRAKKD